MTAVRVLLALLVSVAAGVLGVLAAPSAHADEPESSVSITLTSLSPALPDRDGRITLTGRVTNTSPDPVSNLQAVLWRYSEPLLTADDVDRTLASPADDPEGRRLYDRDYQNIPSEQDRTLAPGASTTFRLSTDVSALDLPQQDGVYLVGVHIRGRTVQDPMRDQTLGRSRTFLPLVDDAPATRLNLTTVVVLASRPSQLRRGVLADDHLAAEVRPGGRLDELLTAAGSPGTSFAVDPALVEELTTMQAGYQVQAGDGATAPGRGQADARSWLARFETLRAGGDGFRLLYGSPDLAALTHDHQLGVLADVVAAGRRVAATASLPLLVLPTGGYADEATVRAADSLDPVAVLVNQASAGADAPLLQGPDDDVPVVRYGSASIDGGGPGPDPRDTPVQLRQRALADTWVEAASVRPGSTRGRVQVVTSTKALEGDDAAVSASWLQRATLSELLEGRPTAWDQTYAYPEDATAAELTTGQLSSLRTLTADQQTYADLLVDGDQAQDDGQAAVARAASGAWRRHDQQRRAFLGPQQASLDGVLDGALSISTNPKVSTVAREGVEFPITVRNQLPADRTDRDVNAVRLRLVFVSENPQRLTIKPILLSTEPGTEPVRAEGKVTRNAQVTARANGTVRVRAQLQTLGGTPVGRARTIDVRVTQNGTTGWAIAGAALVVFVGSTALRIRRVSRGRAADPAPEPPLPSALTSAPPTDTTRPEDPDRRDD